MAKAKKKSITTTAKSLAKNFGKMAVDVQRVALMEIGCRLREGRLSNQEGVEESKESEKGEENRQKAEVTAMP